MKTIEVHTGRPYDIRLGSGLLTQCGPLCRQVNAGSRALIVTDSHVEPLYLAVVRDSLQTAGFTSAFFVFPAGEPSKRLETVAAIYERLSAHDMKREDLVVALGGGVTGDMAGFAAATWLRGIDFVQIPTTLLAQVDSSIGGKTGVDTAEGKNLVGAFHQPRRVIVDPSTLDSLPHAVLTEGMSEVIKAACIRDAALFSLLEAGDALADGRREEIIARAIAIKRQVVERDEREKGERKLLNFGHTFGHALEKHYDYRLSHGYAVAVGMMLAAAAGEAAGITAPGVTARLRAVLQQYDLPVADPIQAQELLAYTAADKKSTGGGLDLILLRDIGEGQICPVTRERLAALFEPVRLS